MVEERSLNYMVVHCVDSSARDLIHDTLLRLIKSKEGEGSVVTTLLTGDVVKFDPLTGRMRVDNPVEEEQAEKQATKVLAEIASSLKRARKTQAEIDRLKKKTQAILDKLQ